MPEFQQASYFDGLKMIGILGHSPISKEKTTVQTQPTGETIDCISWSLKPTTLSLQGLAPQTAISKLVVFHTENPDILATEAAHDDKQIREHAQMCQAIIQNWQENNVAVADKPTTKDKIKMVLSLLANGFLHHHGALDFAGLGSDLLQKPANA